MANCFWFYSILAGWSTWQWVFLNFSQNFWSFDTPDTPGCASAVLLKMQSETDWSNSSQCAIYLCTQINKTEKPFIPVGCTKTFCDNNYQDNYFQHSISKWGQNHVCRSYHMRFFGGYLEVAKMWQIYVVRRQPYIYQDALYYVLRFVLITLLDIYWFDLPA